MQAVRQEGLARFEALSLGPLITWGEWGAYVAGSSRGDAPTTVCHWQRSKRQAMSLEARFGRSKTVLRYPRCGKIRR